MSIAPAVAQMAASALIFSINLVGFLSIENSIVSLLPYLPAD